MGLRFIIAVAVCCAACDLSIGSPPSCGEQCHGDAICEARCEGTYSPSPDPTSAPSPGSTQPLCWEYADTRPEGPDETCLTPCVTDQRVQGCLHDGASDPKAEALFDVTTSASLDLTSVDGVWEGTVKTGSLRVEIRPKAIAVAAECTAGQRVGTRAPIDRGTQNLLLLQRDARAKRDSCAVYLYKDEAFDWVMTDVGMVLTSRVTRIAWSLRKISD
jgi:hypothetical protein